MCCNEDIRRASCCHVGPIVFEALAWSTPRLIASGLSLTECTSHGQASLCCLNIYTSRLYIRGRCLSPSTASCVHTCISQRMFSWQSGFALLLSFSLLLLDVIAHNYFSTPTMRYRSLVAPGDPGNHLDYLYPYAFISSFCNFATVLWVASRTGVPASCLAVVDHPHPVQLSNGGALRVGFEVVSWKVEIYGSPLTVYHPLCTCCVQASNTMWLCSTDNWRWKQTYRSGSNIHSLGNAKYLCHLRT